MQANAVSVQSYREKRKDIPAKDLAKHQGKWVAFSRDGSRIVASDEDLVILEKKTVAAGEDPGDVVLEFLDEEEFVLGGVEFQ